MKQKEYLESVSLCCKPIYRFLFVNIPNTKIVNKLTEEVFSKLWLSKSEVKSEKSRNWLFSMAYRLLLERIKQIKKYSSTPDEFMESSEYDFDLEDSGELAHLKLKHKSMIILRDVEHFNFQEIADILNTNQSSVKTGLYKAKIQHQEFLSR